MSEEKKNNCCDELKSCCGKGHGRTAIIIVGLILLAGIITVAILRDRIVNPQMRMVTVTGQGRIVYAPDIAIVTLGVQIDKVAKPEEALDQLNAKVASIIKEVKAAGIAPENIQTQNYSLYPQYDYKDNISTVSGYNANQQLVIKVTGYDQAPDQLSKVIAAASRAGANQINNLSFDAANMNDLKQQARIRAIEDAKWKSVALADTAGVELKEITGWYENLVSPLPVYGAADYGKGGLGAAAAVSPSTPSGDREVVIEIGVTYNIK
ncbi:MAG: SIMPL domain-containing protein [Patescibacteria group bacterium]